MNPLLERWVGSHWEEGGRASGRGQGEAPSPGERGRAPVSHPAPRAPDLDLGRWLSSRAATSRVRPAATRRGRPVRGPDNVAIVWARQTRPAGRWEGGRRRRASRSGRGGVPALGHRPGGLDTRLLGGLAASPPRGRKWRGAGRRRRERRGSEIKRCLRKEEREGKKRQERGEKEDVGRGEAGQRERE